MLRSKQYKYCLYTLDEAEEELYDLDNDPGETNNLAGDLAYQEVINQHRQYLRQWSTEYQDERGLNYCAMLAV